MLIRPEGLTVEAVSHGNGIVTDRTFLGSLTRISVLLSGDVAVKSDKASSAAVRLVSGTSVRIGIPADEPLLLAGPQ